AAMLAREHFGHELALAEMARTQHDCVVKPLHDSNMDRRRPFEPALLLREEALPHNSPLSYRSRSLRPPGSPRATQPGQPQGRLPFASGLCRQPTMPRIAAMRWMSFASTGRSSMISKPRGSSALRISPTAEAARSRRGGVLYFANSTGSSSGMRK